MTNLFSILMAFTAYSCISVGFVLQKRGIGWIGWKGKKDGRFFRVFLVWFSGFVIMNIYGVPSAVALKRLPAHVVAAFAGWGIVVLVLLSAFFLREALSRGDVVHVFLIVVWIVVLNLFPVPEGVDDVGSFGLVVLVMVPVLLFIIGFFPWVSARGRTIVFGVVSGVSAGLMVVFLKLLVQLYQYDVASYFKSPYLLGYGVFAFISLVALQLACKNGPMMIVGPVQYAGNIIYPLVASFVVFGRVVHVLQYVAILGICFSVAVIMKNRREEHEKVVA